MVSPTPHQSNPHVACRIRGDRRVAESAAPRRDAPRSGTGCGVASISESSDTLHPDSRAIAGIVTALPALGATHIHRSPKPLKTSQIQA